MVSRRSHMPWGVGIIKSVEGLRIWPWISCIVGIRLKTVKEEASKRPYWPH